MIVFSNWKIYMHSKRMVTEYINELKNIRSLFRKDLIEVNIFPDFISLSLFYNEIKNLSISLGVQDIYWEDCGSYAGEVSPVMVKEIGCSCVYIGHSERKIKFHETSKSINKKIKAAFKNNLIPFLFIGETKKEFKKNLTESILKKQLEAYLDGIPIDYISNLVLVYEPVWAIGQEESASVSIIQNSLKIILDLLKNLFGNGNINETRVLYGGSVNLINAKEIASIKEVDGFGSTRGSLNPNDFIQMIKIVEEEAYIRNQINII